MTEIREVKTRREIKEFIDFPLKLYKGNSFFVPSLYADEKRCLRRIRCIPNKPNRYFHSEENGKTVGRIQGILQRVANEKWKQNRIRFTRFDCIDDQEVANELFRAIECWGKSKGTDEIVGPLGYSDLDKEGLLVEGFDQISTFEEQYNYPYYVKLIENCGFVKEVDWVEYKLYAPDETDERMERISDLMMKNTDCVWAWQKMRASS